MQDNGNAIVWEEPPPSTIRRRLLNTSPLVAELKANKGLWARLAGYDKESTAQNLARRISKGRNAWARPAGTFEAVMRRVDGKAVVYVRYVGQSALNGDA